MVSVRHIETTMSAQSSLSTGFFSDGVRVLSRRDAGGG
jgi:hypothetical protein